MHAVTDGKRDQKRRREESVGVGLGRVLETVAAVLPDQFRWTADTNCFSGLDRAVLSPSLSLSLSLSPFLRPFVPFIRFFLAGQSARFNRAEMFSGPAIFRGSLVLRPTTVSILR